MQAERWRRIEELYHAALQLEHGKRGCFLDEACTGDEALRSEIDSLLAYDSEVSGLLDSPALERAAELLAGGRSAMAERLCAGRAVSHYRLLEIIGHGGMGVVYKAEDTTLHRFAALKLLAEGLGDDPRTLARFRREARAASALDHPNICTIYEIGEHEGEPFIAMQFLDGETLKQAIGNQPLKIEALLEIAVQIANGLEAAHRAGIVHRDIKPANIFLTAAGHVKILDFGIAKLTIQRPFTAAASQANSRLPPGSSAMAATDTDSGYPTSQGALLGTLAYMSPEQVRGEELDARTDLFSFGAVLYEMATGMPPFWRETSELTRKAIQNDSPRPPRSVNPRVPAEMEEIIRKALEKGRELRYAHAGAMGADLRRLHKRRQRRRGKVQNALSGLLLLLALTIFWWFLRERAEIQPKLVERQITANPPEDFVTSGAISPDGKTLAYHDQTGIYLRSMDSGETRAVALPPDFQERITNLTWFPDGARLLANTLRPDSFGACRRDLWTISVAGPAAQRLLWRDVCQGSISPDGQSLAFLRYGEGSSNNRAGVWIGELKGGRERRLRAQGDSEWLQSPVWSPDGRWIGYAHGWMKGPGFETAIEVQPVAGGSAKTVLSGAALPKGTLLCDISDGLCLGWSPDWRIVFSAKAGFYDLPRPDSGHSLWEISTRRSTAEAAGKPRNMGHWRDFASANLTFTRDGKSLFVVKSKTWSDVYLAGLAAGKTRIQPPQRFTLDDRGSDLSGWTFDSQAILFSSDRTARREIFKQRLNEGIATPLFETPCYDCEQAVVTPDRSWILYREFEDAAATEHAAPVRLMRRRISGGPPEKVLELPKGTWHWGYACGVKPGSSCVMSLPEGTDMALYALDPLHGRGAKLGTIDDPNGTEPEPWSLSPDGSRIASGTSNGRIRILSLRERTWSEIPLEPGWQQLYTTAWAADGNGFFATCRLLSSNDLIYITPTGTVTRLLHGGLRQWLVNPLPSPDGKYLAFEAETWDSNVWTVENF
jgi:eukaryotic-like serine/threonine-protein kinase